VTRKPATVDDALLALETGKATRAFNMLKQLGESGDMDAYHMLGYLYDTGEGTRRSAKHAMTWYLRSYNAGNSSSATNIATMYREAGNSRKEFEWYARAAALGDGDADVEVAIRLLSGKGVRRNLNLAIRRLRAVQKVKHTSEGARDLARHLLWGCTVSRRSRGIA